MNELENPIPLPVFARGPSAHAAALQRLVHSHGAELIRYIDKHIPDDLRRLVEPQDIVQDTYFEAFQRIAEFAPQDDQAGVRWLKTMARHKLIDMMRINRALKRGSGRIAEEVRYGPVIALLQDLAVYGRTPSRSAASHEFLAAVQESLGRLEPDQRLAVQYRYIDCLSFREAAEKMNRSEGAMRMLAMRGLDALRAELGSISLYV